jgi:hypothetical protein
MERQRKGRSPKTNLKYAGSCFFGGELIGPSSPPTPTRQGDGLSRRRGKRLHSNPGLNFPFADRLVLVLVRITIQNGNSG